MNKTSCFLTIFAFLLLPKLSARNNSDQIFVASSAAASMSDCTILNPYSDSSFAMDTEMGQSFVACQTGTLKSIGVLVDLTTSTGETINIYEGETIDPANLIGSVTGQTLTANGGDNANFDVTDFSAEGISVVNGQTYTFHIPTGANLVVTTNAGYASGKVYLFGAFQADENLDLAMEVVIEPVSIIASETPTVSTANEVVTAGIPIDLTITGALNNATSWHVYSSSCGVDAVTSNASNTISVTPGSGISTYYIRGEGPLVTPSTCGSITVYAEGTLSSTYTGGSWDNGTPNGAYHTIINDDLTATSEYKAYSLTINSGYIVDLNGNNLSITSDLTLESDAALLDDGTLTTIGGTQTVKRFVNADALTDFHLMSVPISNGNYEASFQASYVYRYVGGEYDNISSFDNGADMIAGEGVAISGNGTATTRTYTGTLNKGSINYTLISSDEWHLLGNPYPVPLSFSSFYATNNTSIRPTFYLFNENTGSYDTWNASLSAGTGSATANAGVAQGFFAEELTSSSSQVTYTGSMRTTATNTFLKTAQEKNAGILKLQLSNAETMLVWNGLSSNNEDINDATYLQGTASSGIYSLLNENALTIQAINNDFSNTIIPLGFYALEGGANSIAITDLSTDEDIDIILIDRYENITHDLNTGAYEFVADVSEEMIENRFEIVLAKTSLSANEVLQTGVIVSGGNALNVIAESTLNYVRVYDITGTLVHEAKKINNNNFHWNAGQANAVYIIEVATEDFTSHHKIILK